MVSLLASRLMLASIQSGGMLKGKKEGIT